MFHLAGIRLAPKEKVDVPVLFIPAEMKIYKAVVIIHIRREDGENWPYKVAAGSKTGSNTDSKR